MTPRICLLFWLLAAVPVWSQTTGTGTGTTGSTGTDTSGNGQQSDEEGQNPVMNSGMLTPPPMSGEAYPTAAKAEATNNFVRFGITAEAAYDDNLFAGFSSETPTGEMEYSIWPSVNLDRSTPRAVAQFKYSPGFSYYEPSTLFNEVDHNAAMNLQYLLGEHTSVTVEDSFLRSSSLYNSPAGLSGGDVTGTAPLQAVGVTAAFADRITNLATASLSDQPGENEMFNVRAQYGQLDYPNAAQVPGLYNATAWSGAASFTERFSSRQYLGGQVQHSRIVSYLPGTDNVVETDNLFPFYTIYLRDSKTSLISLSVTLGVEHYRAEQYPASPALGWTPAGTLGIGWQGHFTSLAVNVSRYLTGGGGLSGAYSEDVINAFFRRELSRTWAVNLSGLYSNNKNETPFFPLTEPGGHGFVASASAEHRLTRDLKCQFGYDRTTEHYQDIGALSKYPSNDRVYGSITYEFNRPIGR